MALLILFGFIAGAATAVSPCVLPVLPIALSAGTTGGRRRPLGVVAGLVVSFTFALIALVYVIDALGLPNDLLRKVAIVVLLGFGIVLMVPPLAARVEAFGSRLAGRVGVRNQGDGFWSGVTLGLSLGLLYAPCAGPILAGVLTVSASQPFNAGRLAVVLAYAVGSAAVLYLLMIGGRRLVGPLSRRGGVFQIAMGALMVLVALAMWRNYDIRFQTDVTANLPGFLVNPAEGIENSHTAQAALTDIRGTTAHGIGAEAASESDSGSSAESEPSGQPVTKVEETVPLQEYGPAPEFTNTEDWFNTPGDKPLSLTSLRGRVVLVDFWTYSCINCIRTLPYLKAWDKRYRKDGLTIVGVHTPEFPFEREASNVEEAIEDNGIRYPVAQDNEQGTWNAYGNQYWPAEYFIDAHGNVRFVHFGEGEYGEKEQVIRELLADAGHGVPTEKAKVKHAVAPSTTVTTPETYLGAARAAGFTNAELSPGLHAFTAPAQVPPNEFAYRGKWRISLESATAAGGASLDLNFGARRVYLVLGSPGHPRQVAVKLDGAPISAADAGTDVKGGEVTVDSQRLYNLVDLPKVGHHTLELEFEPGVMGYAFTFG